MKNGRADQGNSVDPLARLYRRPGFLLRRAAQIAAALFLEAVAEFDVTTTQFGTLVVLASRGPVDQISLARMLGLDRSTAGLVVANLERRGAIIRTADPEDLRRRVLVLTAEGRDLLRRVSAAAELVPQRELAMFSAEEAEQFLGLLTRFVGAFNMSVRTPLHENNAFQIPA